MRGIFQQVANAKTIFAVFRSCDSLARNAIVDGVVRRNLQLRGNVVRVLFELDLVGNGFIVIAGDFAGDLRLRRPVGAIFFLEVVVHFLVLIFVKHKFLGVVRYTYAERHKRVETPVGGTYRCRLAIIAEAV